MRRANSSVPRVSVVITCHNDGAYLHDAVCSVIRQSYRDWEMIVVDDGSDDDTSEIIEQLMSELAHLEITLIKQSHGGVSRARNTGIAAARGRYILPLDADDELAETMLEQTVELLDGDSGVDVAYTDMYVFGDHVASYTRTCPDYDFDLLREQQVFFYCSLFRREVWEAVGGFCTELEVYEDWDFWLSSGERGFKAQRIPHPLFGVRHKPSGLHTEGFKRDLELRARIAMRHPGLFNQLTQVWAKAILEQSPEPDYRLPDEILSRAKALCWLSQAFMAMDEEIIRLRQERNHTENGNGDSPTPVRQPWLTSLLFANRRRAAQPMG